MGGNVFQTPARRLSTPQILALYKYVHGLLSPYFPLAFGTPQFTGDKVSHGDLDVIVGFWSGGPGWKGNFTTPPSTTPATSTSTGPGDPVRGTVESKSWTRDEVVEWCSELCQVLGAVKWQKHGHDVSFAIPCKVLDGLEGADVGADEFYQLDVLLVRPPSYRFANLVLSCSTTALFLSAPLRRVSSSFTLHTEELIIRHTPWDGLPPVEVNLTHDVNEFINWSGLDYARWEQGFGDTRAYWRWIACLPDPIPEEGETGLWVPKGSLVGSASADPTNPAHPHPYPYSSHGPVKYDDLRHLLIPRGLRRMARQKEGAKDTVKLPKHGAARQALLGDFRRWLKGTCYADWEVAPTSAMASEDDAVGITALAIQMETAAISLTTVQLHLNTGSGAKTLGQQTTTTSSVTLSPAALGQLEPPRPLNTAAQEALEFFGKVEEWEAALEDRRKEAAVLRERQARRVMNKDLAVGEEGGKE